MWGFPGVVFKVGISSTRHSGRTVLRVSTTVPMCSRMSQITVVHGVGCHAMSLQPFRYTLLCFLLSAPPRICPPEAGGPGCRHRQPPVGPLAEPDTSGRPTRFRYRRERAGEALPRHDTGRARVILPRRSGLRRVFRPGQRRPHPRVDAGQRVLEAPLGLVAKTRTRRSCVVRSVRLQRRTLTTG